MPEEDGLDQYQYADMANGSYYMVTRIMTNAWMWNHSEEVVLKKLDSLLYENVPGKIITKTSITKNGYNGIDIVNKTRRGDFQRYNIFVTPFEIIFFKMSGTADYVKLGNEAQQFFGSIQLKEFATGGSTTTWKKYSPPHGGFAIDLPHEPFVGNDGSWIYDAEDKSSGNHYRVIKSSVHNYRFAEEDSFDLGLLDESFMASEFIDAQTSRKQTTYNGYPALDGKYKDKKGLIFLTRFIIQGPHYYTLIAHGKKETPSMNSFLNSFQIKPLVYGSPTLQTDTSLYYSVTAPLFEKEKKIKLDMPQYNPYDMDNEEEELSEKDLLEEGAYRSKIISNDTTGEKIFVTFYRSPNYYYSKDRSMLENDKKMLFGGDTSWIIRSNKKFDLPNKTKVASIAIFGQVESLNYQAAHLYSGILVFVSFTILLIVNMLKSKSKQVL